MGFEIDSLLQIGQAYKKTTKIRPIQALIVVKFIDL